jgi:hypothetical protein
MRKNAILFSVLVGLCQLGSGTAHAQVPGSTYLHLSLTPDLSGSPTVGVADQFVPFSVYVVADGLSGAGVATIGGAEWSLVFPSELLQVGLALPVEALNLGTPPSVIMGLNPPILTISEPVLLATYTVLPVAVLPADTLLTLGPSSPSSVGGSGPAYVDGASFDVAPFSYTSDVLLNQSAAPTPELYPVIPEPTSLALLGLGALALGCVRRQR